MWVSSRVAIFMWPTAYVRPHLLSANCVFGAAFIYSYATVEEFSVHTKRNRGATGLQLIVEFTITALQMLLCWCCHKCNAWM